MRQFLLFLSLAACAFAQGENHVQWTITVDPATAAPGASVLAHLEARIDDGWHMYSLTTPPGPIPTTIKTVNGAAIANVTFFEPPPVRKYDENFKADTETYDGTQTFLARIELKKDVAPGDVALAFQPRYQTCSGTQCIPARTRDLSASLNVASGAPMAAAILLPAGYIEAKPAAPATSGAATGATAAGDSGILAFLALAFGFGLAAIFTPCVFPMIPITMSYFTGQRGGFAQALTFCLGIIFLFTGLGIVTTLLLGPAGVVQLGSNPWVNGFIALIFFVFGLSLLGAFEITIPSSVLTKMNSASNAGGYIGSLLMGLTFALASFACVGPFIGTLLAASVQGDRLRPVIGMATFSSGLALPFFLLALFPSWLAKMPRSGEWLSRVKVVMGFLVLVAMMKYLYSLDIAGCFAPGVICDDFGMGAPFIHAEKTTDVSIQCGLDVDEGKTNCTRTDSTADFGVRIGENGEAYLIPRNRAQIALDTHGQWSVADCMAAEYVNTEIRVDYLGLNSRVCVHSNHDRYAEVFAFTVFAESSSVRMTFITWPGKSDPH